jgi:hypothetical protein
MTVVAGFMTKAEHDAIDAARGDTSRNASQARPGNRRDCRSNRLRHTAWSCAV